MNEQKDHQNCLAIDAIYKRSINHIVGVEFLSPSCASKTPRSFVASAVITISEKFPMMGALQLKPSVFFDKVSQDLVILDDKKDFDAPLRRVLPTTPYALCACHIEKHFGSQAPGRFDKETNGLRTLFNKAIKGLNRGKR